LYNPHRIHIAGDDTMPLVFYKVVADEQKTKVSSFLGLAENADSSAKGSSVDG